MISYRFVVDLDTRAPDYLVLSDWFVFLPFVDLSNCSELFDCAAVLVKSSHSGLSKEYLCSDFSSSSSSSKFESNLSGQVGDSALAVLLSFPGNPA